MADQQQINSTAPTVSMKELMKIVKFAIKQKVEGTVNLPIYVMGRHGIGKTASIFQIGAELGYKVVVLNLANQSPEELLGFPDIKTGKYHRPTWILDDEQPVIYFLDEMNRAPKHVLQCMFNFINEGRLHQHKIKPQDMVISAGNIGDEYIVNDFDDKAFYSRFASFYLEPSLGEYCEYLQSKKYNNVIVNFVKANPSFIKVGISNSCKINIEPDNRSMEKIAILQRNMTKEEYDSFGFSLFAGLIGISGATLLDRELKDSFSKIYDIKKLMNTNPENYEFDVLNITEVSSLCTQISEYLESNTVTSAKFLKFFREFLGTIPKDFANGFFHSWLSAYTKKTYGVETMREFFYHGNAKNENIRFLWEVTQRLDEQQK